MLNTYGDIGTKAAGRWGRYVVIGSQVGTCVGAGILYIVLAGSNINQVIKANAPNINIAESAWIAVAGALVLPMSYFKTMHELAIMSLFGVLTSVITVIVTVIESLTAPESTQNHNYGDISFEGCLNGIATVIFAYGGHVVFPAVQKVMRTPSHFTMAIGISLGTSMVLYLIMGCVGYAQFGENMARSTPMKCPTFCRT